MSRPKRFFRLVPRADLTGTSHPNPTAATFCSAPGPKRLNEGFKTCNLALQMLNPGLQTKHVIASRIIKAGKRLGNRAQLLLEPSHVASSSFGGSHSVVSVVIDRRGKWISMLCTIPPQRP
jgi:hypothetical protein